jgi:hypothetical protein
LRLSTRWAFTLIVVVASLIVTSASQAKHSTSVKAVRAAHKLEPKAKLRFAKKLEWEARSTIRFFQRHLWIVLAPATSKKAYRHTSHARKMLTHARNLKAEALKELVALRDLWTPAHDALWECIHNGEGSWTDPNAPYYGGLQMSPGWSNSYAPGHGFAYYANEDTPLKQKQAAEIGYQNNGYSTKWLRGQWPNTSPPCMGYA